MNERSGGMDYEAIANEEKEIAAKKLELEKAAEMWGDTEKKIDIVINKYEIEPGVENEGANHSEFDRDMSELMLAQLRNFGKFSTEQFTEVSQNLDSFIERVSPKFHEKDLREIYDALLLMMTLHIDQKDRLEGTPYVSHPLFVAHRVIEMQGTPDKEVLISAILHDSVEDQADKLAEFAGEEGKGLSEIDAAYIEIENKYGKRVSETLSKLSNPDFDAILAEQGITKEMPNYAEMKNTLYKDHVAEAIEDLDVLPIKLADFSENTSRLADFPVDSEAGSKQREKLIKKYLPVMKVFIDRLERDGLYPEDREILENRYEKLANAQM